MTRRQVAVLPVLFCVTTTWGAAIDPAVTWNVALQYEGANLSILDAARIPPMMKDTSLFGVAASYPVVRYELEWLNANAETLPSATMEIGLGLRVPPDCGDGRNLVPEEGAVEFRAIGPPEGIDPAWIRLIRLPGNYDAETDLPQAFQWEKILLPIPHGGDKGTIPDAILGITKIRDTGDDANRIVVVIMSEGYTAENLNEGVFGQDVGNLLENWPKYPPWDEYWDLVNIYQIDVVSQEEGGDIPDEGISVDTYFDAQIEDSWRVSESKALQATNYFFSSGVVDARLILINTTRYGGSAKDSVAVSYTGEGMLGVMLHEMGHHFAYLAEEYKGPSSAYTIPPDNPDGRPNWAPDYDLDRLPWKVWVEEGTPLPTPETEEYRGIIGAFEGARGWTEDVYRPSLDCLMRSLDQPFCPICVEAHIIKFIQKIQLAESLSPSNKVTVLLGSQSQEFKIEPVDIPSLNYQWKLGTQVITDATGPNVFLSANDLQSDVGYLYLTITHTSPHIKKTPPYKRYTWKLEKDTSAVREWEFYRE